jgi:hypothetical protein
MLDIRRAYTLDLDQAEQLAIQTQRYIDRIQFERRVFKQLRTGLAKLAGKVANRSLEAKIAALGFRCSISTESYGGCRHVNANVYDPMETESRRNRVTVKIAYMDKGEQGQPRLSLKYIDERIDGIEDKIGKMDISAIPEKIGRYNNIAREYNKAVEELTNLPGWHESRY